MTDPKPTRTPAEELARVKRFLEQRVSGSVEPTERYAGPLVISDSESDCATFSGPNREGNIIAFAAALPVYRNIIAEAEHCQRGQRSIPFGNMMEILSPLISHIPEDFE